MNRVQTLVPLALTCGLLLHAQTPPVVIQALTREVLVEVTVTDSKGNVVSNLTKQNFTVTDAGKPRVIDDVSINHDYRPYSALPGTLHLANGGAPAGDSTPSAAASPAANSPAPTVGHSTAIVLDEANSFFADAVQARQYVLDLLGKVQPDERIALYVIVRMKGLVLAQDYTTDHERIKASLAKIYPGLMRIGNADIGIDQPVPPYNIVPKSQEETFDMWRRNSDQARLSLQKLAEQLALVPGRKSVFWLTNAFPRSIMHELGLEPGWDKTIMALNKANVAVNTIDTRGMYGAANQVTGSVGTMRMISDGTGGKVYFNRNDVDGALAEGITASRAAYTVRFHLAEEENDNRFHELKVKVDRPGLELFYRQGYFASNGSAPVDAMTGIVEGQSLEARAALLDAPTLHTTAQLSWFYTGADRANVILSLAADSVQGDVEVVGVASLPDGAEAARFADKAKGSPHWHYQHEFPVAAGNYTFHIITGAGPGTDDAVIGKVELPLNIPLWTSTAFAIGGIALSSEVRPADIGDPESHPSLTVGNKQFVPAASSHFGKSDHLYFYTEISEPALKSPNPPTLQVQIRVLDRASGDAKIDTGLAGIGGYVKTGNPLVPFATAVPLAQLPVGSYRLEVKAAHSSGPDVATRSVDFEVE